MGMPDPDRMTPATVHLLAQLIRHGRAALTSLEKWLQVQAQEQAKEDVHLSRPTEIGPHSRTETASPALASSPWSSPDRRP
jgi:hypothetical protein